jgi:hypothetical protein
MKFVANASSLATKGCVALLLALLVGLAPRVALAGPDTSANDAEVEVLVQSVFEAEYPKKQYVEARFQRQGVSLLYWVPWPPSGLYTNVPVESVETQ